MPSAPVPVRRQAPPWTQPSSSKAPRLPPLSVHNSFTNSKSEFAPLDSTGRKVTWYCCGPTVYDAAHLGHARNYVTTDVLRRIMRDYFGFDVVFVQNVTDVDDKIILRARQQYLFEEYVGKNAIISPEVLDSARKAWTTYLTNNLVDDDSITPESFSNWAEASYKKILTILSQEAARQDENADDEVILDEKETKRKMHLKTLLTASRAITAEAPTPDVFYSATSSIFLPYLDVLNKGREYTPEVFSKLSTYWERHFNQDMASLNVLPPTVVTRVSDFIPENVKFVEKLVEKGFAYPTSGGSVYFDIAAYKSAGHYYAKLKPESQYDEELLADGEGALTADTPAPDVVDGEKSELPAEKKNKQDFALWKVSKPGEPSWDSPWGKGRPGWHIECSVMCSEVLGGQVDIHSGGIDLCFPHHDNEIAQSEAYWDGCVDQKTVDGKHQWVNYFLHMGHLSIQGSKMSKSLKNFVSVRDALQRGGWTSRSLRVVFLMGGWKDGIEVKEGVLAEAKYWETTLSKFFATIKALVSEETEQERSGAKTAQPWGTLEKELYSSLSTAREALDDALCDSFNTALAMKVLLELVADTNKYMAATRSLALVKEVSRWITRIVEIFGLESASTPNGADRIGWSDASSGSSVANVEDIAMPYVRALSTFRDKVKTSAIIDASNPMAKSMLILCDDLRDRELVELGVKVDDRDSAKGEPALVKFVPATELIAAREEKAAKAAEKERKKVEARIKREVDEARKAEAAKVDPKTMFRIGEEGAKYEEWDEDGIPTKEKGGVEVTKSKKKNLAKAMKNQEKLHAGWLKSQGK